MVPGTGKMPQRPFLPSQISPIVALGASIIELGQTYWPPLTKRLTLLLASIATWTRQSGSQMRAKGPKECQESCRRKVLLPLPTEKIRKWSDTMKENLSNTSATSLFSFKLILGILVAVMFYPHFSLKYIHLSQPVNCIWSKIPALLRQYLTVYF